MVPLNLNMLRCGGDVVLGGSFVCHSILATPGKRIHIIGFMGTRRSWLDGRTVRILMVEDEDGRRRLVEPWQLCRVASDLAELTTQVLDTSDAVGPIRVVCEWKKKPARK